MADDRIDSIIDLTATQKEVDALALQVAEVVKLIQSIKNKAVEVTTAKSVSEYNKLNKELVSLIQQTDAAGKSVVKTTTAINEQKEALSENIKKQTEYKERIKEITAELKKLEEAQRIVNTSTAPGNEDEKKAIAEKIALLNQELTVKKILDKEITKTITNQVKEIEGINNTTKSLSAQQKEREKEAKAAERQAAASEKAAKKAQEEARPYRQLALAFAAAAKEAQDLGAKYGVMDKRAQAAAKRANELNNELKKIDASIGNHQRNVGNYGSALDGVGTKLKNLGTSFLALIGISSLGSLFGSSINEFVEMEKNVRQLENTLKNLGVPEAFDRISNSANKLQRQFNYLDNDEILKTFNQLIVYGKLTEQQINELIPVIIDFAAASGQDLASATSLIIKSLEGNGRALKEYGINMKDAKNTTDAFSIIMKELKPRVDGVAQSFADSASGGLAAARQEFKDMKEEIGKGLIPVLNSLLGFLLGVGKGAKMLYNDIKDLFKGTPGATNQLNSNLTQAQENVQATVDKLGKLSVPDKLKEIQKEIGGVEYALKLAKDFQKLKVDDKGQVYVGMVSQKERDSDLEYLNERKRLLLEHKKILETPVSTKTLGIGDPEKPFTTPSTKTDDAARKAEELAERIRKANFEAAKSAQLENIKLQEEIFKDESKLFDERIAALREFVQEKARLIELERTFEKGAKGLTKEEIVAIETQKQTELNQLVRDGHQEYNRILKAEQEKEEKQHKETADRIKAIHDKLQKDVAEGVKKANDEIKKAVEERLEIEEKAAELRAELANEGVGLAFDLLTAQYEREKNLIQDQIDLLERKKQKDIEVANATITNARDRADAINIIEARAQAQEDILEQKKRQVSIKEAQFEKAESIANIIAKTAEAIIATLAKHPAPGGLPLAFLTAAIGAAQLARVIATPIPRYAEGTDNHKGGLAVVGDAGKSEGIKLPDGTVMKTPATSTIVDLPKGTKVYPDFNHMMLKATLTDVPVFKETTRTDRTEAAVSRMEKSVVSAIKKIPQPITTAENIISRKIRNGSGTTNYLTRSN